MSQQPLLHWKIDECAVYFDRMRIRGWCHHAENPIVGVDVVFTATGASHPLRSYGQPSPDVQAALGPTAAKVRFDEWLSGSDGNFGQPFELRFRFADGTTGVGEDALTNAAVGDPYFQSWENFLMQLDTLPDGPVLELGSRARSAVTRRHRIPARFEYVGLDILDGPNVNVVGDAHELSTMFGKNHFVAAYSTSVFEHLIMPWKVAIELNRVLRSGGLVYTATHQTWPVHEEPWDFWRFSKYTWTGLFNSATGFDVVEAVMGEPARVHPCRTSPVTLDMPASPAFLASACLARKISDTTLAWPVSTSVATNTMYPAGELSRPPTSDRC